MSGGVAYIGAGLDLSVLAIFKDENLFVLVDSNPRSPYGLLADHIKTSKAFIPRLMWFWLILASIFSVCRFRR